MKLWETKKVDDNVINQTFEIGHKNFIKTYTNRTVFTWVYFYLVLNYITLTVPFSNNGMKLLIKT